MANQQTPSFWIISKQEQIKQGTEAEIVKSTSRIILRKWNCIFWSMNHVSYHIVPLNLVASREREHVHLICKTSASFPISVKDWQHHSFPTVRSKQAQAASPFLSGIGYISQPVATSIPNSSRTYILKFVAPLNMTIWVNLLAKLIDRIGKVQNLNWNTFCTENKYEW